ncbi:MAG: hypothetical protein OXN17_05605 [Candidatus Poribacteria bacterium]|nr:hypothetical protein [Candidatus Poribacteria bacterium]MDE0505299.1 hypothetical protein [Candidatus Poribacteria bacterium]
MFGFYRGILLTFVAAVVAIGCADNADRLDLRVGLFFTEDTQSLIVPHNLRHNSFMNVNYDLRAGKDTVSALARATRRVFTAVEVLDSCPMKEAIAGKRLDLAVIVQVIPRGGSFGYQGSGFQNSSDASNSLSAEMTCSDSDMVEIASISASGKGNATAKGILFDSKRRAFVNSVKAAIRNLEDDVVLQMSTNPEIRKMVEKMIRKSL